MPLSQNFNNSLTRGGIYKVDDINLLMDDQDPDRLTKIRPFVNLSDYTYRIKNNTFIMGCPLSASSYGDGYYDFSVRPSPQNSLSADTSLVTIHLLQLIPVDWIESSSIKNSGTLSNIDLRKALHKASLLFA